MYSVRKSICEKQSDADSSDPEKQIKATGWFLMITKSLRTSVQLFKSNFWMDSNFFKLVKKVLPYEFGWGNSVCRRRQSHAKWSAGGGVGGVGEAARRCRWWGACGTTTVRGSTTAPALRRPPAGRPPAPRAYEFLACCD